MITVSMTTDALNAFSAEPTRWATGEALAILVAIALTGLLAAAIAWGWHERTINDSLLS
jgi:hypothetical protein